MINVTETRVSHFIHRGEKRRMTVLYFQGFILLSIFLVRIVVRLHLALVCVLWTAFTLFSVFYSPLVILQLITIWGSYIASIASRLRPLQPNPQVHYRSTV